MRRSMILSFNSINKEINCTLNMKMKKESERKKKRNKVLQRKISLVNIQSCTKN